MSRIDDCFARLRQANRKALVPYVSVGDIDVTEIAVMLHSMVAAGADMLELGIPFSDPAADGSIIQAANQRALAKGTTFDSVMQVVYNFRQQDTITPIILMGYLNSFERRGFARAVKMASIAGVDGVILVDCPIEGLPDYQQALEEAAIDPILLLAPTTSVQRQQIILQKARGFLYYVSLRGVTGKQRADAKAIAETVGIIKQQTTLPICIGFGIRDGETAHAMATFSDGVIIGSALIEKLYHAQQNNDDIVATAASFIRTIRSALNEGNNE